MRVEGIRPLSCPQLGQVSPPSLLLHSPNHEPLPSKPKQKQTRKKHIFLLGPSPEFCGLVPDDSTNSQTGTSRVRAGFLTASQGNRLRPGGSGFGVLRVPKPAWWPRAGPYAFLGDPWARGVRALTFTWNTSSLLPTLN